VSLKTAMVATVWQRGCAWADERGFLPLASLSSCPTLVTIAPFLGVSCCGVQVLTDFRVLRKLLRLLTQCDCVSFYATLDTLRTASKEQRCPSLWMYSKSGDSLFRVAKERV
jgi:hypothetical protein